MKSNLQIDSASIVELQFERVSAEDLAKSQWALIHNLESQYRGKTVHGTKSQFEDDHWFSTDSRALGSRTGINWRILETDDPALQVLTKAFFFDAISERRLEISSANGYLRRLRLSMIPLIHNKKLLLGKDGTVILGLSHLTDVDLMIMLDNLLVSQTSEALFLQDCYEIAAFQTFANHIAEQVPVYQIRARLPWQKSGEPIYKWVKKRIVDLSVTFPKSEGFEPLPTETVQPVIERSLTLIDVYFDHFAAIAPFVARHSQDNKCERAFVLGLLQKYGPIFGPIMSAPDISSLTETKIIAGRVYRWLRELLYLARGACVNILLLTTGLRNLDLRGLQVGACSASGRVDMLFYLRSSIHKTKNVVILPVPGQTDKAIRLLEKIKFTESPYLLDAVFFQSGRSTRSTPDVKGAEAEVRLNDGDSLNRMIRDFAGHFNIPFINPSTGEHYTAHCYRTTVAGWMGAASNLALLLVRRLFGHSNNVMPTVYLNNNPAFVAEREAQKALASAETARQMALAASQGRLAGIKGEQLKRGYQEHKSRMEVDKQKSHSLTDAEILTSFTQILEQRINSGSVCGFLTPFGVQCMRNPSDTSQPPCAKRANRDKTRDIDPELLKHVSDINPQQCLGTSCTEAVLGPWSTSVLETLNWYRALLRHQLDDAFAEEHFIESAKQFIKQYQEPLAKVFGMAAQPNGPESSLCSEKVVLDNA